VLPQATGGYSQDKPVTSVADSDVVPNKGGVALMSVLPNEIGSYILEKFESLDEGSPGEIFERLLGRARSYMEKEAKDEKEAKEQWEQAESLCRRSHQLVKGGTFRGQDDLDMNPLLAEGTALLYLGVTYLNLKGRLESAHDCLERAAEVFRADNRTASAGLAYYAIGRLHQARSEWDDALKAYQQSLNELTYHLSNLVVRELRKDASDRLAESVGKIDCSAARRRGPQQFQKARCFPVLGEISAGAVSLDRSLAEDEYIALDAEHSGDPTYVLRVRGESMIGAGILNGDYVFIRDQEFAFDGEIAAVRVIDIEDAATLKRYYEADDHVRLQPANDDEKTIVVIPEEHKDRKSDIESKYKDLSGKLKIFCPADVAIEGKLVAVLRVMH
jgi:SOS-response transcriptional repressor LexA